MQVIRASEMLVRGPFCDPDQTDVHFHGDMMMMMMKVQKILGSEHTVNLQDAPCRPRYRAHVMVCMAQ